MKIVNTFHQPSTVIASLKCALSSDPQLAHLVVAKVSRIEVSSIHPEGLNHECSLEIWGRVIAMRAVAAQDPVTSNILVLTDHPDPRLILLTYATRNGEAYLDCTYHCALYDRVARHAEFFTDIAVAPSRDLAVVSCYVGKLKVIQFSDGEVKSEFDVILPEHNVYALSILHSDVESVYPLAIVHMDHMQRVQLIARDLDVASQDLSFTLSPTLPNSLLPANTFPDIDTPLMLVPVPSFAIRSEEEDDKWGQCLGGVLVLGGRKILFYEVASVERQKRQKNKDKRQSKRKSSGNEQQAEVARQKDKEREAKKVKPRMSVKWPWSEVTAWCPADDEMRRFFIGDMYGRLALLVLGERPELILIPLGETSPPTTMSYLSNQILYIGSHLGKPQIVQIHATPQTAIDTETLPIPTDFSTVSFKELADANEDVDMDDADVDKRSNKGKIVKTNGSFVEILESYPNIAPIVDAMLVDTDGSGQPQIVTCSGGRNTGSLNVVRTAADFHEIAVLNGIPNALNVWPIRPNYDSPTHSHLMVSTLRESLLFRFDSPATVTRLNPEVAGLTLDKPTIALANIRKRFQKPGGKSTYSDSPCIVQVTANAVTLVEYDPQLEIFHRVGPHWTPGAHNPAWMGRRIVAASINPGQIVVALSGGVIVVLNLNDNGHLSFKQHREFGRSEISALSCATLSPDRNFTTCIAVAFWDSNIIRLLSLDPAINLQDLGDPQKCPVLPSLPRSILLHNFGTGNRKQEMEYHPYVVAGLADGSIACFSMKDNELKDLKLFPLGTAPVSLVACDIDGKRAVFANGSQSSVLYWDKQRLRQSSVMVQNIAAGASLTTGAFPSCQILATPNSLLIGQIRGVDKMQIRSISLGFDNPKRIACSTEHKVFGVACSRPTPSRIGDGVIIRSSFVLFDDTSFDRLCEFVCDSDEEVSAILSVKQGNYFLIGTVRHQVGEIEPSAGRLLLFSMQAGDGTIRGEQGRSLDLKLLTSCDAEGCVYALVEIDGAIGAAVNTSVDLYRITEHEGDASTQGEKSVQLTRVSTWNHNYFVTSLAARGDNLIAGDAISSVSIVKVKENNLELVARNYGPLWPIAVEGGRDQGVIGANCDCNLFTLSISQQKILQLDGNFHLGDVVTTLIPGRLSTQDEHEARIFEPEHLFFTSSGRIGVIHHVNSQIAMLLTQLQNNMSDAISGPGDVVHSKWRTPTNSRGRTDADSQAIGFLDGDFLEKFLTYTDPSKLLTGVKLIEKPREEIEAILEKLQSLH